MTSTHGASDSEPSPAETSRRVLVTGATGYIGGRLVPHLLEAGHEVCCLVRPSSAIERDFADRVSVATGSADDPDAVAAAAKDCSLAFYLIHSLGGDDFEERDQELAEAFRTGCERAGVERIVYLGGLGDDEDLSPHLRSRQEVGRTLGAGSVAVTEVRAAIIIGSGSASFEMLRSLTEVLPVMTTPSWVNRTRCQPTAIDDVLTALTRAMTRTGAGHEILELGGPDVLTYREMMDAYARAAGLPRRRVIGLPFLSPGLSAHWVSFVTPLPATLATQLVGSLVNDVVVTGRSACDELGLEPVDIATALHRALLVVDDLPVDSTTASHLRELDATPDPSDPDWAGGRMYDSRSSARSRLSPDQLAAALRRPETRSSAHPFGPTELVATEDPSLVRAQVARDRLGHIWIDWTIRGEGGVTRVDERIRFAPRGLSGRAAWLVARPILALWRNRALAQAVAEVEASGGARPVDATGDPSP